MHILYYMDLFAGDVLLVMFHGVQHSHQIRVENINLVF